MFFSRKDATVKKGGVRIVSHDAGPTTLYHSAQHCFQKVSKPACTFCVYNTKCAHKKADVKNFTSTKCLGNIRFDYPIQGRKFVNSRFKENY